METPILTPMQQAIEEIKVLRKKASFEYKAATTNEDKEEWLSSISAIDSCLGVLKTYLPKEQEAIEQAWISGNYNTDINGNPSENYHISSTSYFNQTYKEPKQ